MACLAQRDITGRPVRDVPCGAFLGLERLRPPQKQVPEEGFAGAGVSSGFWASKACWGGGLGARVTSYLLETSSISVWAIEEVIPASTFYYVKIRTIHSRTLERGRGTKLLARY